VKRNLKVIITIIFGVLSLYASSEIDEINTAINQANLKWHAGENWVTKLSPGERRNLLGALIEPEPYVKAELIELPQNQNIPAQFDWRDNNGNWITPVRNQGGCGSCWDFSAVAQIEAWWKIVNNSTDMPDLSEQIVLSCGENGGCDGDYTGTALDFAVSTGIPPESYLPYQQSDEILCSTAGANWQTDVTTIPGWGYVTLDKEIVDNMKNAILLHPLSASFSVYSDFYSYESGVYEKTPTASYEGGHAILVVGWNDEEESWICKNSWGPDWGENGYFRIKWGECGFGTYTTFIYDEVITAPSLSVLTNQTDVSLTSGDSTIVTLTVKNIGNNNLVCTAMDYLSVIAFHIDSYGSYDGSSWWCGSEDIGGYDDHWLQYLETPSIDLTLASNPKLIWKGKWAVEDTAGAISPYDGWDGCNMWISTDGGQSFDVLIPTTPPYNCTSLYSFGNRDEGWDLGSAIPGWGGSSGGWVDVECDLSSYIGMNVIIRWALASDLAYSTSSDANLYGFFVDNIQINDGSTILFSNDGSEAGEMNPIGLGGDIVDWTSISSDGVSIPPNDSLNIDLKITTQGIDPGDYGITIVFVSNDVSSGYQYASINLHVLTPEHDIAMTDLWLPGDEFPIMLESSIGVEIYNRGQNDESNFRVYCALSDGLEIKFSDTVDVDLLTAGDTRVIKFKPFVLQDTGTYYFETNLLDCSSDVYTFNNQYSTRMTASNFIDGFDSENEYWSYQGGWGATANIDKHSGTKAAHVNNGTKPYMNNMDASLIFLPGIRLENCEYATLKFWAIYQIEENKDFCYVDLSNDSTTWTTAMAITGVQQRWKQFQVSLNDFIAAGDTAVWVRFHFVSDASGTGIGILIDDVEIYPENYAGIARRSEGVITPCEYKLAQNYPNPFNPVTKFSYQLPEAVTVELSIFNFRGQLVEKLVAAKQPAGFYTVDWNAEHLPSGIYFYQLSAGQYLQTKKCVLLK